MSDAQGRLRCNAATESRNLPAAAHARSTLARQLLHVQAENNPNILQMRETAMAAAAAATAAAAAVKLLLPMVALLCYHSAAAIGPLNVLNLKH